MVAVSWGGSAVADWRVWDTRSVVVVVVVVVVVTSIIDRKRRRWQDSFVTEHAAEMSVVVDSRFFVTI